MLIGLTGRNAAGKGVVAKYLKEKSFSYHSLSDIIREEIQSRQEELTRENLIRTGNELRGRFGASILAQRILVKARDNEHCVIDSIRNPAEVEALRSGGHFRLLNVEAELELRFERIQQRDREGDPQTYDSFLALERLESEGDVNSQNLVAVETLADHTVENNGTLNQLHEGIDVLLLQLLKEVPRPSWDRYFMDIARVAASRSNCIKRKVAAIIIRDKRIISTGYNGTPRGTQNCNQGGCPRCNSLAPSGTNLGECFCSHGEENAIVQAAYHGTHLTGATIYTTLAPCLLCTKMIINSGITEVVYNLDYPLNESTFGLFKQAGVTVRRFKVD